MSEARQLKKPVTTDAKYGNPRPSREVTREPREPEMKKFPQGAMQVLGHDRSILTITAPPEMTFENALVPGAWVNASRRVAMDTNRRREWLGSLIHLHAAGGDWFAILYIRAVVYDKFKQPCGLQVSCIGPSIDPATGKACPISTVTGLPMVERAEAEAA